MCMYRKEKLLALILVYGVTFVCRVGKAADFRSTLAELARRSEDVALQSMGPDLEVGLARAFVDAARGTLCFPLVLRGTGTPAKTVKGVALYSSAGEGALLEQRGSFGQSRGNTPTRIWAWSTPLMPLSGNYSLYLGWAASPTDRIQVLRLQGTVSAELAAQIDKALNGIEKALSRKDVRPDERLSEIASYGNFVRRASPEILMNLLQKAAGKSARDLCANAIARTVSDPAKLQAVLTQGGAVDAELIHEIEVIGLAFREAATPQLLAVAQTQNKTAKFWAMLKLAYLGEAGLIDRVRPKKMSWTQRFQTVPFLKSVAEHRAGDKAAPVRKPKLTLRVNAPRMRFVGNRIRYKITVTNVGEADARATVVRQVLAEGCLPVSMDGGGTAESNAITWNVGLLKPNESKTVTACAVGKQIMVARSLVDAKADATDRVEAAVETDIRGMALFCLEVGDRNDPVRVGETETYVIRMSNQMAWPCTGLELQCTLDETMEFVKASGATKCRAEGRTLIFERLPAPDPSGVAVWEVVVKALAEGDVRFRASMKCDQQEQPIEESEVTHFYK